jgi:hypothetical protein
MSDAAFPFLILPSKMSADQRERVNAIIEQHEATLTERLIVIDIRPGDLESLADEIEQALA